MAILAGDIFRVDVQAVADGTDLFVNTWHIEVQSTAAGTDQDFYDDLTTYYVNGYNSLSTRINDKIVGSQVVFSKRIAPNTFTELGSSSFSGFAGATSTLSLPYTTNPTVKFGVVGQGRQGRKSVFPLANNVVIENELTPATLTDLLTWANFFNGIAVQGTANVAFGIYKRASDLYVDFSGTISVNLNLGHMITRQPGQGV